MAARTLFYNKIVLDTNYTHLKDEVSSNQSYSFQLYYM